MNYTVITIDGKSSVLRSIRELLLPDQSARFHYAGVFPTPEWICFVPEEPVWIVDHPTDFEKQQIDKVARETSLSATFRSWFVNTLVEIDTLRNGKPGHSIRPKFSLDQTIFNQRLINLVGELNFQKNIRPHLTLKQIYGKDLARVIESYLCSHLFNTTNCRSRTEWLNKHTGASIDGVLVEEQSDLNSASGKMGFCVQTVGGTPWTFFKSLSQLHPELKIVVSDVDIEHSIIQVKIYRGGKIVTTMTTEDTSILSQLNTHIDTFGGSYFYLPLNYL